MNRCRREGAGRTVVGRSALVAVVAAAVAALAAGGCGGKVVFDEGSGGSGNGPGGATDSASVGGDPSGVRGKISSAQFFVDCKPEVSSDPLGGSFVVKYKNQSSAPASLDVSTAALRFENANPAFDYSFTVDPKTSGSVAGSQTAEQTHKKVVASGHATPAGPLLCSFCGSSPVLHVGWSNGTSDDFTVLLGCGF